jgi:hypothetical protein
MLGYVDGMLAAMATQVILASGTTLVVEEPINDVRGKLNRPQASEIELTEAKSKRPIYINPSRVEYLREQPPPQPPRMPRTGR